MSTWIKKTSMPTAKHDFQIIGVGPQIYSLTGSNDLTVDVVEIYDIATDQWTSGPPIPTRRGYIGAALLDGWIYVVGGKTIRTAAEKAATGDDTHFITNDSMEALDLRTQTWSCLEPLPAPRAALNAAACRGKIYAIGGCHMDRGGDPFDHVDIFDPASGHWEPGVPLPLQVWGLAAVTVDDKIYVMGGGGHGGLKNDLHAFDPDKNQWTALATMPTARSDLSAIALDRKIYAIGGKSGAPDEAWGCTGCVEIYDIATDTWSTDTPMPQKKAWLAATATQGRIFAMGGANAKKKDSGSHWTSAEYFDDVHEYALD